MAEDKAKKPVLDKQIRLTKDLHKQIQTEATRLDVFDYQLVEKMWEAYQSRTQEEPAEFIPKSGKSPKTPVIRNGIHNDPETPVIDSEHAPHTAATERRDAQQYAAGSSEDTDRQFREIKGDLAGLHAGVHELRNTAAILTGAVGDLTKHLERIEAQVRRNRKGVPGRK